MMKESKMKQDFCQSRYFKNWNPDTLAEYNRWVGVGEKSHWLQYKLFDIDEQKIFLYTKHHT